MNKRDMVAGDWYAFERQPHAGSLSCVEYVGYDNSRMLIRHLEGDLAGQEEAVLPRTVVCEWAVREAFVADRDAHRRQEESDAEALDDTVQDAATYVLEELVEDGLLHSPTYGNDETQVERLWSSLRLPGTAMEFDPTNYRDRFGKVHVSHQTRVFAASTLAANNREAIEEYVAERRHRNWFSPSAEIILEWAGGPKRATAAEEATALRALLDDAIAALTAGGMIDDAQRLTRALEARA